MKKPQTFPRKLAEEIWDEFTDRDGLCNLARSLPDWLREEWISRIERYLEQKIGDQMEAWGVDPDQIKNILGEGS